MTWKWYFEEIRFEKRQSKKITLREALIPERHLQGKRTYEEEYLEEKLAGYRGRESEEEEMKEVSEDEFEREDSKAEVLKQRYSSRDTQEEKLKKRTSSRRRLKKCNSQRRTTLRIQE